jgi:predicted enzyme related to lactoylglutathione lyase
MTKHHQFNYIELPATDLVAMKEFYGAAFGWTFQDWGETYVAIHGAGVDGGMDGDSGARKPSDQGALLILYSEDLPATERAVVDAGAKISVPTFDFPGGRRFHFIDPSGNELAVWTPAET